MNGYIRVSVSVPNDDNDHKKFLVVAQDALNRLLPNNQIIQDFAVHTSYNDNQVEVTISGAVSPK